MRIYKSESRLIQTKLHIDKQHGFCIEFNNFTPSNGLTLFFQSDLNVWWVPRIIRFEKEKSQGKSIGWLFAQIGYLKFQNTKREVPPCQL